MDPQIRYCTASDGTRIAYWAMGSGPSLLLAPPGPVGDILGELRVRDMRALYERLALSFTLLRYDPRGSGSSERNVSETHEARVLDMAAAAQTQEGPVAISASLGWSATAIHLAATQPALVRSLILWDPVADPREVRDSDRTLATRALIEHDWNAYTDAWAHAGFGWGRAESAKEWSRWYRAATTAKDTIARIAIGPCKDVSQMLKVVHVPTLVVGHRQGGFNDPEASKRIASSITDARLVVLDGPQKPPTWDANLADQHAAIIEEFLGVAPRAKSHGTAVILGAEPSTETAIILFADVVDSTATAGRLGNAAFRERTRQLEDLLRGVIREAGGVPVEGRTLGDGVIGVFKSAEQAIDAALRSGEQGGKVGLELHLGIHAGDVIHEAGNVSGMAVSVAARISDITAPNELLVSATVRDLARASTGVVFEDRGEREMKGVGEPVRVYAVR